MTYHEMRSFKPYTIKKKILALKPSEELDSRYTIISDK